MPVMLEDDLGRRIREIEFTLKQTFYDREHFHDELNEFITVRNFELEC